MKGLKVGDRVRIINDKITSLNGKLGTIYTIREKGCSVDLDLRASNLWKNVPFGEHEVELDNTQLIKDALGIKD